MVIGWFIVLYNTLLTILGATMNITFCNEVSSINQVDMNM